MCEDLKCVHKKIFPMEILEFLGYIFLGSIIALANAGGIGGGGIIVVICMVFIQFDPQRSVACSNFCIFIGAIIRLWLNFKQKHPEKNAISIDYAVITVMLPLMLLGTMIGVEINMIIPPIFITGTLTILLLIITYLTVDKASEIYKKETAAKRKA
jgi:uncharacterized membrane protein YfcA